MSDVTTSTPLQRQDTYDIQVKIFDSKVNMTIPDGRGATTDLEWQFTEDEYIQSLQALELRLLSTRASRRRVATYHHVDTQAAENPIEQYGIALFNSIIREDVRLLYFHAMEKAEEKGKIPRVQIFPGESSVASLPLELMVDLNHQKLALCLDKTMVRCMDIPFHSIETEIDLPVRILAVISNPLDANLDYLDVEKEKALVDKALEELVGAGVVELKWLKNPTWHQFQREVSTGSWHVLHFIGHGHYDTKSRSGSVAFTKDGQVLDLVNSDSFGDVISAGRLRFVLLNTCEGAKTSHDDAYSSTAANLIKRRIPAVLAMQYEISDTAAIKFSHTFYDELAHGSSLEKAVTSARMMLQSSDADSYEWATPVLYMNSQHNGLLFDLDSDEIEQAKEEWRRKMAEIEALRTRLRTGRPSRAKRARQKYRLLIEKRTSDLVNSQLTAKHTREINVLTTKHTDEINNLSNEHSSAVADLRAKVDVLNSSLLEAEERHAEVMRLHQVEMAEIELASEKSTYQDALHQIGFQWQTVGAEE